MSDGAALIRTARGLQLAALSLVALSILIAAHIGWAQPVPTGVAPAAAPVLLEQAIARGKAGRQSVRIVEAEVDAARARLNQARALFWPSLDLTANLSDINNYDTFSGVTASAMIPGSNTPTTVAVTQTVPRYQASSGLQLRYDVYTGGRISAQFGRQEQDLLAAEVKRQIVLRDVALEIAQAYFRLRRACIKHDTAQRNANRAMENLKRAQQRLRDGTIAALDVSETELALTEKQVALRTTDEDIEIAQTDFIASQNEAASATDAAPNCNFPSEISADLARVEKLADTKLEGQYDRLRVGVAQQAVEVERAALKPQLSLSAQYTAIGRGEHSYSGAFDDFSRRQAAIGLDFSLKLFDGGYRQNRIAEAQAEAKRLGLMAKRDADQRQQTRKRNDLRVRIAQNRVELAHAQFELAQKQSAVARERQSSGSGSAVAVDEQAERVRNAQDEYRLAQLDLALARVATLLSSSRIEPGASNAPDVNTDQENLNHG
jgi:OMF family outer membrane factor